MTDRRPEGRSRWWGSVRVRITVLATTVNAVVLVVASVALLALVERELVDSTRETVDAAVGIAAEQLGDTFEDSVFVEVQTESGLELEGVFGTDGTLVQGVLFDPDLEQVIAEVLLDAEVGDVIDVYDPIADGSEPALAPVDPRGLIEAVQQGELELAEGADTLGSLGEETVAEARANVRAVRNALIVIVPTVVVLLGAATWLLVGRTLAPVHAISSRVRGIGSASLDQRVPVPGSDDEIAELAGTMNQMLERIESGAERQQRFVADASHELRSPLSTIRAAAEIAQVEDPDGSWGRAAGDVVAEADRMEALIADLLDLARLDEQRRVGTEERRDLAELVGESVQRFGSTGDCTVPVVVELESVAVTCVPGLIDEVARNLLENACRYASARVVVTVGPTGDGQASLVVEDDGPGVLPEDRERVFSRFVRVGEARDRSTGGSGLGLPLVAAVAARHSGTVSMEESPSLGGARLVVRIPAATD